MHTSKKILAFLMALAMLAAIPVTTASAESDPSAIISEDVLHSITTEDATGNGLAFLVSMNVQGAAVTGNKEFVNTNATAQLDGVTYKVSKMGVVLTNKAEHIANIDSLTLDGVDNSNILDAPAVYLWDYSEDVCSFAVRVINIPAFAKGYAVACRPYVVLETADGDELPVYGSSDISSFITMHYFHNEEEIPTLQPATAAVDARTVVSAASAEYVAIVPTTYKEGFAVNMTLENTSAEACEGGWVEFTARDAAGNAVDTQKVTVGALDAGAAADVSYYVPVSAASIEVSDSSLTYVPNVTLPAIGTDIDVVKKKNRIRVSAAAAAFNEDGDIAVSMTFRNYTSNWITEETNWVAYTCYDANGNVVQAATKIYIGCIDTKKNKTKTFNFVVPANTAEVKLTNSSIVYWTEWA